MIIRLKQILNSFWVQNFIKNHSGFNRFCGTSPPLNATLLQSFSNLLRFGKYLPDKPALKQNFTSKFYKPFWFKDNSPTSRHRNATLLQSFIRLGEGKQLFHMLAFTNVNVRSHISYVHHYMPQFSPPITSPFLGRLRLAGFRRKPKTIADVRAIDERVKHVNGVFSLENTESEYKKGALFVG